MSYQDGNLASVAAQIERASANLALADAKTGGEFAAIRKDLDELFRRTGRPGGSSDGFDASDERRSAITMCKTRHDLLTPKIDAGAPDHWEPSSSEVDEAMIARRCFRRCSEAGSSAWTRAKRNRSQPSISTAPASCFRLKTWGARSTVWSRQIRSADWLTRSRRARPRCGFLSKHRAWQWAGGVAMRRAGQTTNSPKSRLDLALLK